MVSHQLCRAAVSNFKRQNKFKLASRVFSFNVLICKLKKIIFSDFQFHKTMTFTCCVPGCKTATSKMFHSFPKDKLRCQRWISNTKCFNLNCEIAYKTHHKVCKLHFKAEDYTSTMLKYLKNTAVPSLNLPPLDVAMKKLGSKNVNS